MFVPDYCARDQGLTALCLRVSSAGTRLSAAIGSGCYSAHRGLPVMSVADGRPHRLRFATFEVDAGSRELFRQGRKVKLQEQPFQLLVALLERPGEVLTREELKQRVWPDDTVVDFDRGLNRAINRVRDALGDSAENPRFVETLPRHGYRFIAPVQQLDLTDALPAMDGHTAGVIREPPAGPASRTRTFAGKLALLGAAAVIAVAAALLWNPGHWRGRLTAASPGPQIRSVAVLPFENLSNDPTQEYFADGITDELITDLATLNGVRVISRTSVMPYKGKRQPLPAIAGALGVDAVVEGSVARSNQRVRITAQLLLAREDRHLWAERFGRMFHLSPVYAGRRSTPPRMRTICRDASSGIEETCPIPSLPSVISNGPSGLTPTRRRPGPVWPTATTRCPRKSAFPTRKNSSPRLPAPRCERSRSIRISGKLTPPSDTPIFSIAGTGPAQSASSIGLSN